MLLRGMAACLALVCVGRLEAAAEAVRIDPFHDKTIVPVRQQNDPLLNPFNKLWVTKGGKVIWFFVSGRANEGIATTLDGGDQAGNTLLQYKANGEPVNYARPGGAVTRVRAPYAASATVSGNTLRFSYKFLATHTTKAGDNIGEEEQVSLVVSLEGGRCSITASASSRLTRNGQAFRNQNVPAARRDCRISSGLR